EFAGHRIRRIVANVINTLAGNGTPGSGGDGGIGPVAQLNRPAGLGGDSQNNLYVADSGNNRIRVVSISSSVIGGFAGTGNAGFGGDGDFGIAADLNAPLGISVDAMDNVYIADTGNNRIRVMATNGMISTVFGNGSRGFSGDSGVATLALLDSPRGV